MSLAETPHKPFANGVADSGNKNFEKFFVPTLQKLFPRWVK
jgi:hypothetical protein